MLDQKSIVLYLAIWPFGYLVIWLFGRLAIWLFGEERNERHWN
jgi:hypothetical protein